jgi:hypothetical protein
MKVRLEQRWIKRLLEWPESGMGYQRVDVRLADGRELKDLPVFNAEEIELPEEFVGMRIKDLHVHAA